MRSESLATRQSSVSSASTLTTSGQSPEDTVETAITPISVDDTTFGRAPKVEERDECVLDDIEDVKSDFLEELVLPPPRRRGRPRKHPVVEQKKVAHPRSKTGCGTCRRRKKKCDEGKPSCRNCEKNNVVCDGYTPRELWRSGKQKVSTPQQVPAELPLLIDGIECTVDQLFFQHFICLVSKVLCLTDRCNPYLEIIVPMAMSHAGSMHSLLYLSGSHLIINREATVYEWQHRYEYHSSKAIQTLQDDLNVGSEDDTDDSTTSRDASIAQILVLCLQTQCVGDLTGSFRHHLNAMKEMLTLPQLPPQQEQFRRVAREFLIYHDYVSLLTSQSGSVDHRSLSLLKGFESMESVVQQQIGDLVGIHDGLFDFLPRIWHLREPIRRLRFTGEHWWNEPVISEAFAIDKDLRQWRCTYQSNHPRYAAALLYRQCIWIYLQRTIQPSRGSSIFKQAVAQGLEYLRMVPWTIDDGSVPSILLMPLFILGCAAFDGEHRLAISKAFDQLQEWRGFGNIKHARNIVQVIWEMMDESNEKESWDWESMIAERGWHFMVT